MERKMSSKKLSRESIRLKKLIVDAGGNSGYGFP